MAGDVAAVPVRIGGIAAGLADCQDVRSNARAHAVVEHVIDAVE